MTADALSPCVARSSEAMALSLKDGQREREREIKFIGLFENRGHRGPYSPYKPFNHNLYIGIIIFPHIDWKTGRYLPSIHRYCDVIMGAMVSLITSPTIVYSTVYWGADQRKHQSSASLAFVRGIHRSPVNSPHKGPVTRKMFPFDDVIMEKW